MKALAWLVLGAFSIAACASGDNDADDSPFGGEGSSAGAGAPGVGGGGVGGMNAGPGGTAGTANEGSGPHGGAAGTSAAGSGGGSAGESGSVGQGGAGTGGAGQAGAGQGGAVGGQGGEGGAVGGQGGEGGAAGAAGASGAGAGGVAGGGAAGAKGGLSTCDDVFAARPVVVGIGGENDGVAVLQFVNSKLVDKGLRLDVGGIPEQVALRGDGLEALVTWGGFGSPYGVAVIAIGASGTTATLVDNLTLGDTQTPGGVAYGSSDHAIVVTGGPTDGTLVPIDRVAAHFKAGTEQKLPGNFPLKAMTRPGHEEVLVPRVDFQSDTATQVLLYGHSGSQWALDATPGSIRPIAIDLLAHPGGDVLFSPTDDPNDEVSVTNLDAHGLLHLFRIADGAITQTKTVSLPAVPTVGAIDPAGGFLVLPSPVYTYDPNSGTPESKTSRWMTIPLDATGQPGTPMPLDKPFNGLLFDSFVVTTTGHLVSGLELWPEQAPEAKSQPVNVWAQPKAGVWEVCQTTYLNGNAIIAVAP